MAVLKAPFNPQLAAVGGGLSQKKKQLEMLEAMLAQMVSPTIQAGRITKANWGDSIGRVAEAMAAKKVRGEVAQGELDYAKQIRSSTLDEMTKYMGARNGTPEQWGGDGMGPPVPGQKGDIMKALVGAMASGLPSVQDFAEKDYVEWQKGQLTPVDLMKTPGANVPSRIAAAMENDPTKLQSSPHLSNVDGQAVVQNADTGAVQSTTPVTKFGPMGVDPNTGIPGQYQEGTNEFTGKSGGNLTPRLPPTDKAVLDSDMQLVKDQYPTYQGNVATLGQLNEAMQLVSTIDPQALGTVSSFRAELQKLGSLFGGNVPEGITQFQQLKSALGEALIARIRLLAPVTQSDVAEMKAIVGSTDNSPEGLKRMIEQLADRTARQAGNYEKILKSVSGRHGLGPDWVNQYMISVPQASGSPGRIEEKASAPGSPQGRPPIGSFYRP